MDNAKKCLLNNADATALGKMPVKNIKKCLSDDANTTAVDEMPVKNIKKRLSDDANTTAVDEMPMNNVKKRLSDDANTTAVDEGLKHRIRPSQMHCGIEDNHLGTCNICNRECHCCLKPKSSKRVCSNVYVHLSVKEQICQECVNYRIKKAGHKRYMSAEEKQKEVEKVKNYVIESILPYWLQCTKPQCQKWRKVEIPSKIDAIYVKKFECDMVAFGETCGLKTEESMSQIQIRDCIEKLYYMPAIHCNFDINDSFLQNCNCSRNKLLNYLSMNSLQVPESTEEENIQEYSLQVPESTKEKNIQEYLQTVILSLWKSSPYKCLTAKEIKRHLHCRGLVRVYLCCFIDILIEKLTQTGVINYGFVSPLRDPHTNSAVVAIIGAGMSGLIAANQLQKIGIKTIILEASDKIGGRISENQNACHGCQFIDGVIDNPLIVLSQQADYKVLEINSDPVLIDNNCNVVPNEIAHRMFVQFRGILQSALSISRGGCDANWLDTISKYQVDYHKISYFSEIENLIFQFMFKYIEAEFRTNSSQLTLKNYEFPEKHGSDGLVLQGLSPLAYKLAMGLDIRFQEKVNEVNYTTEIVEVRTNKELHKVDKVIVTVPLPILQKKLIKFIPELPGEKQEAIQRLGDLFLEKITLMFPTRFWDFLLMDGYSKFGIISENLEFQYFSEVTSSLQKYRPTLITYITNKNAESLKNKSDEAIIEMCIKTLRSVFEKKKIDIPNPIHSSISRWSKNEFFQSSGSCVKVGSSYNLYDELAKSVNDKIFFAGEATYRKCPNSCNGALKSGLREAGHVAQLLCPIQELSSLTAQF